MASDVVVPSSQCAICLRPFTDGHGDICARCWSFIPHDKMTTWDWAILRGISVRPAQPTASLYRWGLSDRRLLIEQYRVQAPLPVEPRHGFDCKTNPIENPETLARIVQDALRHPYVAATDPWIKTPEQWAEFGPDRVFVRTPIFGLPCALPYVPPVIAVEGTLHVKCAIYGCPSEYVSNEGPSPNVRYVCSHHTNAQLRRARILKTKRTDTDVHFDKSDYRFNHKTPRFSPEWGRHKSSAASSEHQSTEDYNGRNDSDRGHSPTDGVHRPYKYAPHDPAYAPFDPIKLLFESHPTLFAARRGDAGEGVEHLPDYTPAQRKRLEEIAQRWRGRIDLAKRQGQLNENPTKEQVVEFLRQDQQFAAEVADSTAIDEGKKLESKMETKRRRDTMNKEINHICSTEICPSNCCRLDGADSNFTHAFYAADDETRLQLCRGGFFAVVLRDQYRIYALGALGTSRDVIDDAYDKLWEDSKKEAVHAAHKKAKREGLGVHATKQLEDEVAARADRAFEDGVINEVEPADPSTVCPVCGKPRTGFFTMNTEGDNSAASA